MAITRGYCTLPQLRDRFAIEDPYDDETFEHVIGAVSRRIDTYCEQRFWQDASVVDRYFTARDGVVDLTEGGVGGVSTLTGLIVATDDSQALTYGTTWASTDYRILPLNAAADSEPWTSLIASPVGTRSWPTSVDAVKVTAKFGWATVPEPVREACLLMAGALFKRKDSLLGIIGSSEWGTAMRLQSRMDPDVAALLHDFRRYPVAVG